jgi:hypothetical protein
MRSVEKPADEGASRHRFLAWVIRHPAWSYDGGVLPVEITGGYCWSTLKCLNWCAQYAFFEGKKAKQTYPRKSTSRTLKEDDQQYPGVLWASEQKVGFDHANTVVSWLSINLAHIRRASVRVSEFLLSVGTD